uniref:Uncharacterized protein n=1 Tax=Ditylum brightwellii TaxID=49249 RepID=A0A7S4T5B4_9STRA
MADSASGVVDVTAADAASAPSLIEGTVVPNAEDAFAPGICRICGKGDDGRAMVRFLPDPKEPELEDITLHVFCGKTASILSNVSMPHYEILSKAGLKNKHGIGPDVSAAIQLTRSAAVIDRPEKEFYLVKEFEAKLMQRRDQTAHRQRNYRQVASPYILTPSNMLTTFSPAAVPQMAILPTAIPPAVVPPVTVPPADILPVVQPQVVPAPVITPAANPVATPVVTPASAPAVATASVPPAALAAPHIAPADTPSTTTTHAPSYAKRETKQLPHKAAAGQIKKPGTTVKTESITIPVNSTMPGNDAKVACEFLRRKRWSFD